MPGEFSSKRHILFDLDGTLVDSSPTHARAFIETLQLRHPALAAAFHYPTHQGRPTCEVFRTLGVTNEDELTTLTQCKQQLYRDAVAAGQVTLFPGVPALLEQLRAAGLQLFVVTGASRASTEQVLTGTGLDVFFVSLTTAEDTGLGKPSPEPYRHTLSRHHLDVKECLAVEDAVNGVLSARAAWVDAVLVNTDICLPGFRNIGPIAHLASLLLQ